MDSGSSCKVIYEHCFLKLKPSIQASKVESQVLLVSFSGEKSWAIGEVLLEITIGNAPLIRSETLNFVIVWEFPIQYAVRKDSNAENRNEGVKKVRETSPENIEGVFSCIDAEEKIIVNSKYLEQTATIRKQLPEHFKERLRNLPRTNTDVFAWTHADMMGIPRTIMVAQPVMVKKSDGGWRMCVNFTNINKSCPKDCYPLPEIDWKVESLSGFHLKCFLDTYKGYHQIQMAEEDDDKTASSQEIESTAHIVAVLTNSSIKQALKEPKKSGRVAKWAIELGEHDIMFETRDDSNKETPKDFLIEAPPEDNRKEVERNIDTNLEETKLSYEWKLYTDGASSSDGSGARLMLIDPEGKEYTYALRFKFKTTNNKAEYEALLAGLRIAQEMEIINLETLRRFRSYTIEHIRRNQNKKADALSKLASMTFKHLTKEVLVEVLARRSIEENEVLQVETKDEESWMTPIREYLPSGLLPEDPKESRKIIIKAPRYKQIKVKKREKIGAIAPGNACPFSHWGVNILGPLSTAPGGLKFLAVAIEHSTKWIEAKPLTTVLWVHITLLRNNQEETPFSLTYGSEIIIPTVESIVAKYGRGRTKEVTKRKESKEVASIEKAYYQNELHRPRMSLRLIKRIKESDSKSSKSSNIIGDYVPRGSPPSRMA
ncbi:reverse transcriptase domain-containing protein [Tanacetum coccineum]